MGKSTVRIGIFGNFGGNNLGNEGTLEAFMDFLREARPDAEFVCICYDPDTIARTYAIPAYPMRRVARAGASFPEKVWRRLGDAVRNFRSLRKVDLLIVPGTGILDDFGESPQGIPFTIFNVTLSARMRRIPVWFVSIGAGPIDHPLSRWLMKSAARMASYRSYRDGISRDFMNAIGLDARPDPIYPDLAFRLAKPANSPPSIEKPLRVGVGVMTYFGWNPDPERGPAVYETYLDKITSFVLWLLGNGHSVRLLQGEKTDQRAVDDLLARLEAAEPPQPADRVIAEDTNSLTDLMLQIAETDIVVATRFHNVVCALKMGRPVISLGYASKNDALLGEWGLGAYCQYVETFDVELLKEQFERIVAACTDCQRTAEDTNRVFEQRLDEQETRLTERMPQVS